MGLGLVLAGLVGAGRPALAAPAPRPITVEDIRVGFDGRYKIGTWTPVWVLVRGGPDGFNGFMEAAVEDETNTPTLVRQPIQVAAGGVQRVTVYVRPGTLGADFGTLSFYDGRTGRKAVPTVVIGDPTPAIPQPQSLNPVRQNDYQLVGLGHPRGLELISKLPGFNADPGNRAVNDRAHEVTVSLVNDLGAADQLPGRWYGYDSADAVVIDTSDAATFGALNSGRIEAIRQWVERGGHLVVAVSSRWQAVNDGPLAVLLPAKLVGQAPINPFDAIESFTGGSQAVRGDNLVVPVAKLEEIESRGGRVLASTLSTPLVVRGAYGFGLVTLITFDVDAPPFNTWPDRNLFWTRAISLKAPVAETGETVATASQRLVNQNVSDLATLLRRTLDQFEGMSVIPFGYVAGFIALYILLIGPGDYFFLKKVLKRMELTWVTFPTIVVVVSLLAYYAAYRIKGTNLRVNQIDVVDVDQAGQMARGTTWINLFSPQNRDYDISVHPLPITPNAQADSPSAPGTETIVSWFAAPESGFLGMNRRGQGGSFGSSPYAYEPMGRAEKLNKVRVGIWSTKAVVTRWFAPAPQAGAILDVDLQPVGVDRLAGTVTNRLNVPLREAMICFGKQVYYQLGTIEPGATVQVDATLNRTLANEIQEIRKSFFGPGAGDVNTINRGNLVREMMFHDSDASGTSPIPSRTHREIDLTGQLLLDRPMLVAQIDRPGAVLELGNAPGEVQTNRTTLLRVILPLKPEATAAAPAPSTAPKEPRP